MFLDHLPAAGRFSLTGATVSANSQAGLIHAGSRATGSDVSVPVAPKGSQDLDARDEPSENPDRGNADAVMVALLRGGGP